MRKLKKKVTNHSSLLIGSCRCFLEKDKKERQSERVTSVFFASKHASFQKKQTDIWSKFECQRLLKCDWIWGHSAVRSSCLVCIKLIHQLLHKIFGCGFFGTYSQGYTLKLKISKISLINPKLHFFKLVHAFFFQKKSALISLSATFFYWWKTVLFFEISRKRALHHTVIILAFFFTSSSHD